MNKKKILLIWPRVQSNTFWSFSYALKFIGKKSSMPPLGLITVASLLPKNWEIKLIDMNVSPLEDSDINWADYVFISAMIVQKLSFLEVLQRCFAKSKIVIAGGPLITVSSETFRGITARVIGEAEGIIDEIIDDIINNRLKSYYKSSSWPDISNSVVPRFDLLNLNSYASMAIQYSRGCPFKCEFCDIWTVYGNHPRLKNSSSVLSELNELYRLGWRGSGFVVDDNFIGNKRRLKAELLPEITKWQYGHNFPFCFYTEASINIANDPELLVAMRSANFDEIFIGIESPAESSLEEVKKTQNLKLDMVSAVKTIQKHGIEVMGGFIVGFDSDDSDIFKRQFDFIQKAAIPKAMLGLLTAVPGTKLYKRLKNENRLRGETSGNNTSVRTLNFIPKMDLKELISGYCKTLEWLYGKKLKNYFNRCNELLDAIEYRVNNFRKIKFNDMLILLKSFFFQSLMPYGRKYIFFIFRNFIKNRKLFPSVVSLAIQGHHFYKITRQTIRVAKISCSMEEYYQRLCCEIDQYSKNLFGDSKETFETMFRKSLQKIEKWKKKINKIHNDFREDLLYNHKIISKKIFELFNNKALGAVK